ncbi:MAG: hypothetical protein ACJ79A_02180 [Gemmatimonadaceae bacterium]
MSQTRARARSGAVTLAALLLLSTPLGTQRPRRAQQTPSPVGTWRGTSRCLVRPSPCKDEIVVYRIAAVNASDSQSIDARKTVNGAEEEMGVLGCRFHPASAQVACGMRNGTWRFDVRGDSLVGELRLPDGTKFRDVRTARARVDVRRPR